MKPIDVAALTAPISPETPAGPDLEYDPDFVALEEAARTEPEQQFGETLITAREPDWVQVRDRACALLARTKDLRVALYLTQALVQGNGLSGLAQGVALMRALLATYWEGIHPQLDPEDDLDPTERVNLIASLCDPERIIAPMRQAPLIQVPGLGGIRWRDVLIARGQLPPPSDEEEPLKLDSIEAAIRDLDPAAVREVRDRLASTRADVDAIEQGISERVGVTQAVSLESLTTLLSEMGAFLEEQLQAQGIGDAPPNEGSPADAAEPEAPSVSGGTGIPGELRSRQDVIATLDRIIDYYHTHEPSSPIPLLLERAKRLVSAGFLEVLQDIAPDGVAQAEQITGARLDTGDTY